MIVPTRCTAHGSLRRSGRALAVALIPCAALPVPALAHTSDIVAPRDLMHAWQPDPLVVFGVLLAGWCYARGLHHLERVATAAHRPPPLGRDRVVAFWVGLATLLLALASPLDTMTSTVFWAHMIQHVLLIAVAPPLLLLGRPLPTLVYGLPRRWRRPVATLPHRVRWLGATLRLLTAPLVAFALHTATLWLWHAPALYQAAVRHPGIHLLEHAAFFLTALLFWWELVPTGSPTPRRIGPAMGILALFAIGMQGAALGMILTFWGRVLYPVYEGRSELWGLSAASDQRLAGLIMWIPAGSVYVIAALLLVGTLLASDDAAASERSSILPSGSTGGS